MQTSLAPAWLDYRNRLAAGVAALALAVLWLGGADALLREVVGETVANAVAAALVTAIVATLGWIGAFRCPFCAKPFHWDLWIANPVTRRCVHCGFERWRDPAAARALRRS